MKNGIKKLERMHGVTLYTLGALYTAIITLLVVHFA